MQILYTIKVKVSEYCWMVQQGIWKFPILKKRCPACHKSGCTMGHGYYKRWGYDENNHLIRIKIKRYLCRNNASRGLRPATISLLLDSLAPYKKYSLIIMSYCVAQWKDIGMKINQALENLWRGEYIEDSLQNLEASQVYQFIKLFGAAFHKYRISRKDEECSLEDFIGYCRMNNYHGAEVVALEYYEANGGWMRNSHFLFGVASQFRKVQASSRE